MEEKLKPCPIELKPCPFCGSEKVCISVDNNNSGVPREHGKEYFYVICRSCTTHTDCWDDTTPELAAERWNRRVGE